MNRRSKGAKKESHLELYEAILTLKTLEECVNFFDDLCSVAELRAIEQRYHVARMLSDGHIYSSILEQTGASSATISRVNRSLLYGKGSYDVVFSRLGSGEDSKASNET